MGMPPPQGKLKKLERVFKILKRRRKAIHALA